MTLPVPTFEFGQGRGRPVNADEAALFATGTKIYADSLSVGLDYCKTMIGTATASLALYYALFAFILPKDYKPTGEVWGYSVTDFAILPPAAFLIAALIFTFGYLPSNKTMSLESLKKQTSPNGAIDKTSIEAVRDAAISRRKWCSWLGTIAFAIGLFLIVFVIRSIAVAKPAAPVETPQQAIVVSASGTVSCGNLAAGDGPGIVVLVPIIGDVEQAPVPITDAIEVHLVDDCP